MQSTDSAYAPTAPNSAAKDLEPVRKFPGHFRKQICKEMKGSLNIKKLFDSKKLTPLMTKALAQPESGAMCFMCGQKFPKSQSLGGHMSKKHPGESQAYKVKQAKRNLNEEDRLMRKSAKEYFALKTNKDPAAFRPKITQIKKIFIALDSFPSVEDEKALNQALNAIVTFSK